MYHHPSLPPAPPPKPANGEGSRIGTPATTVPYSPTSSSVMGPRPTNDRMPAGQPTQPPEQPEDPGDQWLPLILKDKSKQDLEDILRDPQLLAALTYSPSTIHASLEASYQALTLSLEENMRMTAQLLELEGQLSHQRAIAQSQLLSAHALERYWRQKQSDMDNALGPFSPSSLYQRLSQGLQEQETGCHALEESFLDTGLGSDVASEREVNEWTKKYRDVKKDYYLRRERKARWDEGRVGGWR